MSKPLQEWIDAALVVAGSNGMSDDEVIPTWPELIVEKYPDLYPPLTIGALREYRGSRGQAEGETLQEAANKVCGSAPEGWVISLGMENGSAWVEATTPDGDQVDLPDSADRSLAEQLDDALCVASGWEQPPKQVGI